jgi:hypothetical protein
MSDIDRFKAKVRLDENGCWLWQACFRKTGYGAFGFRGRTEYAHRVAYELFVGEIPQGKEVCHHCDVRACVNPNHLFVGTRGDNMRDASAKGRIKIPARSFRSDETHQPAKLTNAAVRFIRGSGESSQSLARRFGVSRYAIWSARTRRTFREVA